MRTSYKLPKHELTSELELYIRLTEKDPILEPQDHIRTTRSSYKIQNRLKFTNNLQDNNILSNTIKKTRYVNLLQQATQNTKRTKIQLFSQLLLEAQKKKILYAQTIKYLINFLQIWTEAKIMSYLELQKTIVHNTSYVSQVQKVLTKQPKSILKMLKNYYLKIFELRKNQLANLKYLTKNIWYQLLKYKRKTKKHLQKTFILKNLNFYKKAKNSFDFINLSFLKCHVQNLKNLNL